VRVTASECGQRASFNLRVGGLDSPTPGSIAEPFRVLAEMQRAGLIKHLGVSNVTVEQIVEAQSIAPVACVQNFYNIANRRDDALIDYLAEQGIAYVPFFPLGGFTPLQSETLSNVAARLNAKPMSVALAWLLKQFAEHSAYSRNIISRTPERKCCWL
jgi:pyridoxine 4-dehydrogenase